MSNHVFDQMLRLDASAPGQYSGRTSPDYWNMVGPFGGATAAALLQSVLLHPDRIGEPLSFTVNYAGPVADGPFEIEAKPVRTNRSTQHWTLTQTQVDADGGHNVVTTATAVTAARRDTWGFNETPMPAVPAPESLEQAMTPLQSRMQWLSHYDLRAVAGNVPDRWEGQGDTSLSQLWMRDNPPRPLDFCSLAAMADMFFPRVWLRRATLVPVGTVSLTVYFHAGSGDLDAAGDGFLLGQAQAQEFRNGFFDQTAQVWARSGMLLATTHQIVYFKQ